MSKTFRWTAGLLVVVMMLITGCSRQGVEARRETLRSQLAEPAKVARRIYPYSLIPGGVTGEEEFRVHRRADPLLTAHYSGIGDRLLATTMPRARWMFASYRIDDAVYWTKRPLLLHAGEPVLTDGNYMVRGRCGNRLSDTPQTPVRRFEPPEVATDTPRVLPELPTAPPLVPVIGPAVRIPGLTALPPAGRHNVAKPRPRVPLEQTPIATAPWGPPLFPPVTVPPLYLFPRPPGRGKPLPPVWTPPGRPVSAVPEPGTLSLLFLGLGLIGVSTALKSMRKRREKHLVAVAIADY